MRGLPPRAQQYRILLHLPEKTRAESIALDPRSQESLSGEWGFGCRPLQKLFQDGAQIGFPAFKHWPQ